MWYRSFLWWEDSLFVCCADVGPWYYIILWCRVLGFFFANCIYCFFVCCRVDISYVFQKGDVYFFGWDCIWVLEVEFVFGYRLPLFLLSQYYLSVGHMCCQNSLPNYLQWRCEVRYCLNDGMFCCWSFGRWYCYNFLS